MVNDMLKTILGLKLQDIRRTQIIDMASPKASVVMVDSLVFILETEVFQFHTSQAKTSLQKVINDTCFTDWEVEPYEQIKINNISVFDDHNENDLFDPYRKAFPIGSPFSSQLPFKVTKVVEIWESFLGVERLVGCKLIGHECDPIHIVVSDIDEILVTSQTFFEAWWRAKPDVQRRIYPT